jgi:signal transduction histidine kinase
VAEGGGLLNADQPLGHRRFSAQILAFQSLPRSSELAAVGSGRLLFGAGRDNLGDSGFHLIAAFRTGDRARRLCPSSHASSRRPPRARRRANQLFGRVQGLIEQERRFTADAAHELRTPIAGIRAQAQVARGATDEAERIRALHGVIAGYDRATHTVEQMLTLARLAPDAVSFQLTPVQLGTVLRTTIADLAPAAVAKDIEIALTDGTGVLVSGDAGLLGILFRNVIDNAIRYSPSGTHVDVHVQITPSDARVTVSDAGPGLSAEQLATVAPGWLRPGCAIEPTARAE